MRSSSSSSGASQVGLLVVVIAVALGGGAYYWWQQRHAAPVNVAAPPSPAPAVPTPAPAASAPGISYPVRPASSGAESATALPALPDADSYVADALTELLGRKDMLTFVDATGFVRHVVATVDNLARPHAAPALWPVTPAPGRFMPMPEKPGTAQVINPDNSLRYSPLVQFMESVNTARAVRLYTQLYPLFQQAYEELGYPGRYFNDRLVAVIDHLIATPVQEGPLGVQLLEVKGPIASERPWVRYEFSRPELEALSSGQKILLRTGPVNHRRLKAKLMELRKELTRAAPGKASPGSS